MTLLNCGLGTTFFLNKCTRKNFLCPEWMPVPVYGRNVAWCKGCATSSTQFSSQALTAKKRPAFSYHAVDGNTRGGADNSFISNRERNPYWSAQFAVQGPKPSDIKYVRIFNREDACWDCMRNLGVYIGNKYPTFGRDGRINNMNLCALMPGVVPGHKDGKQDVVTLKCKRGAIGRIVAVQIVQSGRATLQLAEVQAFDGPPPPLPQVPATVVFGRNVAWCKGCPTSSTQFSSQAPTPSGPPAFSYFAVDGKTQGTIENTFRTNTEKNPYWSAQFAVQGPKPSDIKFVRIFAAEDACWECLRNLGVYIGDSYPTFGSSGIINNMNLCGNVPGIVADVPGKQGVVTIKCKAGAIGRIVAVQIVQDELATLELAEVQAYDGPIPANTVSPL